MYLIWWNSSLNTKKGRESKRQNCSPGIRCGVGGVGQSAHACGVGDLKSRPAVMSGQSPWSVVHVVVCKWSQAKPHVGTSSPIQPDCEDVL